MSVQTELNRLQAAKTGLTAVLSQNGVAVSADTTLDEYPTLFSQMGTSLAVGLYKATFLVTGWRSGSDGYTQTVTATPVAGSTALTSGCVMASPLFVEDTYQDVTWRIIKISGGVVEAGRKTLGNGTITCATRGWEKPPSDVEVFFLAKKGS